MLSKIFAVRMNLHSCPIYRKITKTRNKKKIIILYSTGNQYCVNKRNSKVYHLVGSKWKYIFNRKNVNDALPVLDDREEWFKLVNSSRFKLFNSSS